MRLLSSRCSCQTGRDVTDKKYTSSCSAWPTTSVEPSRDHESIVLFCGHLQTARSSHIGMDGIIGRILCSAFHVCDVRPMLPTRLIQTGHCSIFVVSDERANTQATPFFFGTLLCHASFNTVRVSLGSDFLLARVHTHPFTGVGRGRWITSVVPSTPFSRTMHAF